MSKTATRVVAILKLLASGRRRLKDVADELGIHASTALRILQSLEASHFVYRDEDRKYRLGSGLIWSAQQALGQFDLRTIAAPFMRDLADASQETVHLAILEGNSVVYINKLESQHPIRMYSSLGRVAPLHCTGVAKAIIAFLPEEEVRELVDGPTLTPYTERTITTTDELVEHLREVRRIGYATDREEHEPGIQCIAAPIWNADSSVGGAMSISAPAFRTSWDTLEALTPSLLKATHAISVELGWGGHSEGVTAGELSLKSTRIDGVRP